MKHIVNKQKNQIKISYKLPQASAPPSPMALCRYGCQTAPHYRTVSTGGTVKCSYYYILLFRSCQFRNL